jgi:transposase-like protein
MNFTGHRVRILTVQEFSERFDTDEQCAEQLRRSRWRDGFVCPACGHAGGSYVVTRRLYQCTACRRQTSVTAGTIFHKTRVPLRKWFWALYRMGQDKKGISAMMLRKEIGVSYPTAWIMLQKIRHAMASDERDRVLHGTVELDDAYLGGFRSGTHGRGAKGKTPFYVAAEVTPSGGLGSASLQPTRRLNKRSAESFAQTRLDGACRVRTDGLSIYQGLGALGYVHEAVVVGSHGRKAVTAFPWVHTLISNLKRFVLGRHHAIAGKHAVRYLGEFAYRLNRRCQESELFAVLLDTCAKVETITYSELKAAEVH